MSTSADRSGAGLTRREMADVMALAPPAVAAGKRLGAQVEITADGLWAMALGEGIDRMGVSVETAAPHLGLSESRLLHSSEWQTVHTAPRKERGKLATRMWVRKDAALQLLGYGLTVDPGRIDAGHPGDRGRVRLEHPDGVVSSVHVTDVRLSDDHLCAIATWYRPDEIRYWGEDSAEAGWSPAMAGWAAV
ncbi:hypothetical protein DVA86_14755 [Streptomyces armeniacus]|uniref:Uncharacterized protein n=1 Tax=Streptomyces armeniacus TaxID=83291 RepID=A0A345XQ11_9ACTN|nr:4-phosphopantetheinyl transferase family protein [Streptomyces armeniacus]AXK33727.1 hypothetical protein DVA86_14755 [Streptomyces armeniacus]